MSCMLLCTNVSCLRYKQLKMRWQPLSCDCLFWRCLQAPRSLAHAGVPPRLVARWRECNPAAAQQDPSAANVPEEQGRFVSAEQRAFFGMLASYKDVVLPLRAYPTR